MTIDGLLADLRFAARLIRRRPAFTATALVTLALGVGANTAIFSVVNQSLLRPLPYRDPGRLVVAWETLPSEGIDQNTPAPDTLAAWRARSKAASGFAALTTGYVTLTGQGEPARLRELRVDHRLFTLLGAAPMLGRGFRADEDRFGGPRVALLSHDLWTRRFNRDPAVVGRFMQLDGQPAQIIGVLPADLPLPAWDADVWLPLALSPREAGGNHILWVLARLAPGATAATLQTELAAMLARGPDGGDSGIGANVVPLDEDIRGAVRPDLWLIFAVTGVVLLIGCANVAAMLLALGTGRQRELSVRAALGAGRARLVRQLLAESLILALLGGAAGLVAGAGLVRMVAHLLPASLSTVVTYRMDLRVLGFGGVVSIVTAALFGLVPAYSSTSQSAAGALRSGVRVVRGRWRSARGALVVAETALAVVLLCAAGLIVQGFGALARTDMGVVSAHVLTFELQRADAAPQRRVAFYQNLDERLSALPGVVSVGLTSGLPIRFLGGGSGFLPEPPAKAPKSILGLYRIVSGGYFQTLGIPMLRGRTFTGRESDSADPVAIVSRSYADAAWGTDDVLGRGVKWADSPWFRIIAVVGDVRVSKAAPVIPTVYFSYSQVPSIPPADVIVRTSGAPLELAPEVRALVHAIDPNQPVSSLMSFDELVRQSLGRRRFTMSLMASFAALALMLAAIGLYGVMSFLAGRRAREIGIRLAVGATPGQVRRQMLADGLRVLGLGALAGLAAATWLDRVGAGLVPGLGAANPAVFAAAAALLVAAGLLACDVPARRAMRVDPVTALRED
jgi:putative ABC transport system permease protein